MQKFRINTLSKSFFAAAFVGFFMTASAQAAPTVGWASFYKHGVRTANGEAFDPKGLTAAHRTLPFGTLVRVVNVSTGKSVIVRINDRGPFVHSRMIDLSLGAASAVGIVGSGVGKVSMEVVEDIQAANTPCKTKDCAEL